jgi:hypothetical protein
LFFCGEHVDATDTGAGTDGQPWFEWSVINADDDDIVMQKRWAWDKETDGSTQQWCAGLYSDGDYLYTLVGTNQIREDASTVSTSFGYSLAAIDLIYNDEHHLYYFDLGESTMSNVYINAYFQSTDEYDDTEYVTHFVAGASGQLHSGGWTPTDRSSFIAKWNVNLGSDDTVDDNS